MGVFLGLAPPGQFGGSHEIPLQLILDSCAVGQVVSFHLMLAGSAASTRRAGRGRSTGVRGIVCGSREAPFLAEAGI